MAAYCPCVPSTWLSESLTQSQLRGRHCLRSPTTACHLHAGSTHSNGVSLHSSQPLRMAGMSTISLEARGQLLCVYSVKHCCDSFGTQKSHVRIIAPHLMKNAGHFDQRLFYRLRWKQGTLHFIWLDRRLPQLHCCRKCTGGVGTKQLPWQSELCHSL